MNLFCLVEDCFYFSCPKATLYKLNNEYHVEPYLSDPVQTYLIVSNQVTFLTPSNSLELIGLIVRIPAVARPPDSWRTLTSLQG